MDLLLEYLCLIFSITLQISSSYLILPFNTRYKVPSLPPSATIVGEPLILTPLIKSKKISEAREKSNVKPFFKNIISNSGYLTVEEKYNSNLFFWFFRKTGDNWKKAPVILWLQGGPGCASLYGLFEENGPFLVTKNGLKRRKYAWTNEYNVLYIDQPVGTGYSFTNSSKGYVNDQNKIAHHLYEALTQFFQLYSELKNNDFYICGESYAGKYAPAIGYKIHKEKLAGKCNINLKGLFVISAYSDPVNMNHLAEYTFKIGLIDGNAKNEIYTIERSVESLIHSKLWRLASIKTDEILKKIRNFSHGVSLYDYTKLRSSFENEKYIEYVQTAECRNRIHVGNTTYFDFSPKVSEILYEDICKSVSSWIEELLEHYPVAFVGGQLDVIVAYPTVTNFLEKLRWSGAAEYLSSTRKMLYDKNHVVAYSKTAGNLTDILVRRAGHMVPGGQPRVTLSILKNFINKTLR